MPNCIIKIMNAQPAINNYKYNCIATNSCGNIYSSTATLYVTAPATPSVSIAVTRDTICAGNHEGKRDIHSVNSYIGFVK